jgi:hypothetical protein
VTERRFPPPWTVVKLPGGFKVVDAQGQSLAYVYSRESEAAAGTAGVLTEDEARRIASNIAKLPALLGAAGNPELDDFPEGGG